MLPSSRSSLIKSGMSPAVASATMITCFLGGVIGIQILSSVIHRFIPSHVVDCDHAHRDGEEDKEEHNGRKDSSADVENQTFSDDRPLLSRDDDEPFQDRRLKLRPSVEVRQKRDNPQPGFQNDRRPSLQALRSFMASTKSRCGEGGPCFGYSNPCGNECYRVVSNPSGKALKESDGRGRRGFNAKRAMTNPTPLSKYSPLREVSQGSSSLSGENTIDYGSFATTNGEVRKHFSHDSDNQSYATIDDDQNDRHQHSKHSDNAASHHHHHVASNAFFAIGLQTSIAIALHKLPEGFITFATNHANPRLGFSIFMALFIHNITEGFALALPLYLALNSRLKAMIWASILGGASQPLGAGIAMAWLKVAQSRDMTPSEGVYGVMFAITSGIMTNVALQLFSESLELTHKKLLCTTFAFIGMGILGFSNALTA
ncbi:MAG: hypothetical protein LQ340_005623 [Diploschistes diacapsis]|nr:MAG: hypothetical protein LQ340_005623 [Diploschistes diacapsis]